ncbi:phosphatidate cytidylyltransferase, mitochondrial [Brevipalpus obovatus]|uniref:phosphatidate cytidylyltransferase, mitochondrial n=1 Tax=Brevipalpus obovatus TaxID=246614 RepID=UPI003D9F3065
MSLVNTNYLKKLLSIFPNDYCFAFAYGSAIYRQSVDKIVQASTSSSSSSGNSGNNNDQPSSSQKMIDLVLVVNDSSNFHRENLKLNPSHYSFLRLLGSKMITHVQDNFAAKVYYNSLITIVDEKNEKRLVKYGVINTQSLIDDLLDWNHLYIAGRLHKPVKIIHPAEGELAKALSINHQNAFYASLLLLSETFSEEQLFTTITNMSYDGDFRMIIGEDRNKVTKIVKPNLERFRHIYQPYIGSSIEKGLLSFNQNQRMYFQDLSSRVIFHNLSLLPKRVQRNLYLNFETRGRLRDLDDVLLSIAQSYQYSDYVRNAIKQIVWSSSISQSFKGLLTSGFLKSVRYASRKILKMTQS